MLTDTYNLVYLITNSFNMIILSKFMNAFFEKRSSKKLVCALSYLAHFLITSAVYLLMDLPLLTLLVNLAIMFCITLNYESNMGKRLLTSLYILLFTAIPEFIVGACTGYFHFSFFSEAGYHDSIGVILVRLLTYMEALLFKNFKNVKNNQKVTKTEWAASIFIPIITMVLEIIIIQANNLTQGKVLLSLALVLILNLIAFYLYDSLANSYARLAKVAVLEKENELYSKQCEIMQNSTEELQSFRHDLSNQFVVINELLDKQEYNMAKAQISTLSQKTTSSVIYSTTGNVVIDGLINYKLQYAINENVKVNSEIAVPCDLEIDTTDIVTILGNLLDNAIRAVKELPEDEKRMFIKVVYSQGRLIIQITNPYKSEIEYQNGEIVSSKSNRHHHGFGLKNVENAVEKYDGFMEINPDNYLFKVDILLYLVRS